MIDVCHSVLSVTMLWPHMLVLRPELRQASLLNYILLWRALNAVLLCNMRLNLVLNVLFMFCEFSVASEYDSAGTAYRSVLSCLAISILAVISELFMLAAAKATVEASTAVNARALAHGLLSSLCDAV
eukprot:11204373-Lingulodinium_polyedra.AAC.2